MSIIPSLCTEIGTDKEYTDMDRPISSSHLPRVYSEGSSVRPSARQTSPTLSLQKTGDHFTSTSRSVSPFSSCHPHGYPASGDQPPNSSQPDSVLTVEDALMRASQSQSMQDGPSGLSDASQRILIEALPLVLVLHLNRVRYDATAGGIMKIGKSIRFGPDLEIPLGTIFHLSRGSRD